MVLEWAPKMDHDKDHSAMPTLKASTGWSSHQRPGAATLSMTQVGHAASIGLSRLNMVDKYVNSGY